MNYRHLGRSGLQVSELSLGAWVTAGSQVDEKVFRDCMAAAHEYGVNFFDNAEAYAGGKAEEVMGAAFKKLGWRRGSYVVSTKFYWGLHDGPNERHTLNRKYLLEAIDGSLKRYDLEYVDLIFCHRADPSTPIEETVWALHNVIEQGKALVLAHHGHRLCWRSFLDVFDQHQHARQAGELAADHGRVHEMVRNDARVVFVHAMLCQHRDGQGLGVVDLHIHGVSHPS